MLTKLDTYTMNSYCANLTASFVCLPARKISNLQLASMLLKSNNNPENIKPEKELAALVKRHTGIIERRFANDWEASSDLAIKAIYPLLLKRAIDCNKIGSLLTATTSGDHPSPATAHFIHRGLNLNSNIHCLDLASSCSSFLSALRASFGFITPHAASIIVASEVKHKMLAKDDIRTLSLFSDGAGGIYLEHSINDKSIFCFPYIETNSEFSQNIFIPVGGSREPCNSFNINQNKLQILNPKNMYLHTVKSLINAINQTLIMSEKQCRNNTIGLIFIHQANKNILKDIKSRLPHDISKRIPILIADVGNMVCASLPVLRARVNFLRAIIHEVKENFLSKYLVNIFTELCKRKNHEFFCDNLNGGLLFKAKWCKEDIFIFDDNCNKVEESWLGRIAEDEFRELAQTILECELNQNRDGFSDMWVVAGGGFQTVSTIHFY